jgi:hypothetical protein
MAEAAAVPPPPTAAAVFFSTKGFFSGPHFSYLSYSTSD